MTRRIQQQVLIASMLLIAFLAVMSVNGAFLGAARAKVFFNSPSLAAFWCVLLASLAVSLFGYPGIRRRPALWAIHAGCWLVLAGGLWGSSFSHRHFAAAPLSRGVMLLRDGQASSMVFDEAGTRHDKLPFTVAMVRTWAVYYDDNPRGMVKDYYSTLQILDGQTVVKEATIEVNLPLYYGGYHFYQHTFGTDPVGAYSGLLVTSARGVWLVFAGYAFITLGLIVHFWAGVLRRSARREERPC